MEYYRRFSLPIGCHHDVQPEILFPELHQDFDSQANVDNSDLAIAEGFYDRHVEGLRVPTLAFFPAAAKHNNGAGVLVCPGGGYKIHAMDKEGYDICRYLNSLGFNAFSLNYRIPSQADGEQRPWGPLRDAQRALRVIRSRAAEFQLEVNKLGIMGFSAGGHLAACASTMYRDSEEKNQQLAAFSCKPDFSVLIYPVVGMEKVSLTHEGSIKALLGKQNNSAMRKAFSPNLLVDAQTPPAFIMQAGDDPIHVENSLLYYQALRKAKVPVEMHLYAEGGHGFGMIQRGLPVDFWPDALKFWLLRQVDAQ